MNFDFAPDFRPLAARMRPATLAEYIGQSHLLGEGKPLQKALGRVMVSEHDLGNSCTTSI